MHWHSHWERVFGKARGRKRYIQLSRLKSKKTEEKNRQIAIRKTCDEIHSKTFLKRTTTSRKKSKKKQTAMDAARMEPEGYLTTTVPPIKQTNKQERTEAEAWKQILEKRVSKFFNKATAPVNRYVKSQNLSSFNKCLVLCRNM